MKWKERVIAYGLALVLGLVVAYQVMFSNPATNVLSVASDEQEWFEIEGVPSPFNSLWRMTWADHTYGLNLKHGMILAMTTNSNFAASEINNFAMVFIPDMNWHVASGKMMFIDDIPPEPVADTAPVESDGESEESTTE